MVKIDNFNYNKASVKTDNSNYNKVSVKTDSAVKLIETLKDLGVFKEKRKPRASKAKKPLSEDIRQDNDMKGYVEPVQVRVEADRQGLTDEDVETKTNALVAQIRGEIAQNRIDDLQRSRKDLFTLFNAVQPRIERTQQAVPSSYDPFFRQSTTITDVPDTEEERFTETLNEGGPDVEPAKQETIFTPEEQEIEQQQSQELVKKQKERVRRIRDARKAFTDSYGLPEVPSTADVSTKTMREYFINFMVKTNNDYDSKILTNSSLMRKAMIEIIDSTIL